MRARTRKIAAAGFIVVLGACTAQPPVLGSAVPNASQRSGTVTPVSTGSPSDSFSDVTPSETGQPQLTDLEREVIEVLSRLGIVAMRAEIPFENANLWAELGDGRELFVSAVPVSSDNSSFVVSEQRLSAGVMLAYGTHAGSGDAAVRFTCSDRNYYVRGDAPDGYADMDLFVEALVLALECTGA